MHLLRTAVATGTALAAAVAAVTVGTPAAHEAWFVEHPDRYPLDPSALLSPPTVAVHVEMPRRRLTAAPRPEAHAS